MWTAKIHIPGTFQRCVRGSVRYYPALPSTFRAPTNFLDLTTTRNKHAPPILLIPDFVSNEEHDALVADCEPRLRKQAYETGHWDAVITQYREYSTSLSRLSQTAQAALQRAFALFPRVEHKPMPSVHILDLHASGTIDHHIDSVKFSGDIVCGISLLSDCVMELRYDPKSLFVKDYVRSDNEVQRDMMAAAEAPVVRVFLPRRSLYMLIDEARYEWSHAILGGEQSYLHIPSNADVSASTSGGTNARSQVVKHVVPRERRISIILRDEVVSPRTHTSHGLPPA